MTDGKPPSILAPKIGEFRYVGVPMRNPPRLSISLALGLFAAACGGEDNGNGSPNGNGPNGNGDSTGRVRFVHAAGAFQALDVYVSTDLSRPIVSGLMRDTVSDAVTLPAGSTSFLIPDANGAPDENDFTRFFQGQIIREGRDVLVVLYVDRTDGNADLQATTFADDLSDPTPGTGLFRFYHVDSSISQSSVQFWDANDNRNLDELVRATFAIDPQATDDQSLPLGEYIVGVSQAGREEPELVFDLDVLQDNFRVFLTPQGSNSRLLLVNSNYQTTTVDEMPYMGPGEGQMSFVHLADRADPVDVYLVPSSGQLPETSNATNLMFGAASGLRSVVADTYEIRVFGNGADPSGTPLASLEDVTLEDGQTRVVAIYDGNDGPAILALSPETTDELQAGQFRYRVIHLDRELMDVDVLNASNPDMPALIDPSFNGLSFGEVTDYRTPNVPAATLDLGVDADEREDLEVIYNIPDIQEDDSLNIFLDRGVDAMGDLTGPVAVIVPLNRTTYSQNGATIPDPSFIRLMHVSPNSPSSKLFVGTSPVMGQDNIDFGTSATYSEVEAGTALTSVTDTAEGSASAAYARDTLTFGVDQRHTVVVYGRNPGGGAANEADLTLLDDDPTAPTAGRCKLRVFHGGRQAAGPLPPAIVSASPGAVNFGQVQYGEASIEVELDAAPAGEVTVRATIGADQFAFEMPELVAGRIYTAYLVNDFFESPAIVSLVLQDQDGNTQSLLRQGEIRLAHFLSFPGANSDATLTLRDQNGMAVDLVASDGSSVTEIGPVPFAAYSGPFRLNEGSYTATLEIDGQPLVSGQLVRVLADETVTLGAVGDATVTTPSPSLTEIVEAPPASVPGNELEWRLAHGVADLRLDDGMPVNSIDVYDLVMNPNMPAASSLTFAGGVSAPVRAPSSSFQLAVDYDQDNSAFEQTFNVAGLNDTKTYTLFFAQDGFLGLSMNPNNDRAPLALFAVSNDVEANGGTATRIGAEAELSFFHLAAGAGPVDVFANANPSPLVTNVPFQGNSNQRLIVAGTRNTAIAVADTGDTLADAFLTFTGPVFGGRQHTAVAYVDASGSAQGAIFQNRPTAPAMPTDYRIRIIHTAGGLGDVNLVDLDGGMAIATNVSEGSATGFLTESSAETLRLGIDVISTNTTLPAMTYDPDVAFDIQGLIPGAAYNLLLVANPTTGDVSGILERIDGQSLEALPLSPLARVRLANFSNQNLQVDLYANGVNVGSDGFAGSPNGPFPFDGASEWAFIAAGTTTVEAVTQGMMPGAGTIESVNTNLAPGGSYTYVLGLTGPAALPVLVEQRSTFFGFGNDTRLTAVHVVPGVGTVDVYDNANPASPVLLFDDLAPGTASGGSVDVASGTVFDVGVDVDLVPPEVDFVSTFPPQDLFPGMFQTLIAFDLGGGLFQTALLRGDGSFSFVPLQ